MCYSVVMFSQKTLTTTALVWVPLAAVFTIAIMFGYTATQQNYRQSLNDPQVQVAEDAAAMLSAGQDPQTLVPRERVNVATSLAAFINVYNEEGNPIVGSGVLNGTVLTPPKGTFTYASQHGVNKLSLQPRANVRVAAVIKPFNGPTKGFVLSGRSMREVESRIDNLTSMALITWFVGLAVSMALTLVLAAAREKA